MSNKMVQINTYTDDVVILSRTLEALEEALEEVDNTAQEVGLILNQEKTKYMGLRKKTKQMAVGGCRFEKVVSFQMKKIAEEITHRIEKGN